MVANRNRGKLTGEPVTQQIPTPADGVRMETFIPWTLVKRGAKKQVITPLDAPQAYREQDVQGPVAQSADTDSPLLRNLGLAHHWQRLLDRGYFQSLTEIAQAEGLDIAQVSRMGRLVWLNPNRIEQMVQRPGNFRSITRKVLPALWSQQ